MARRVDHSPFAGSHDGLRAYVSRPREGTRPPAIAPVSRLLLARATDSPAVGSSLRVLAASHSRCDSFRETSPLRSFFSSTSAIRQSHLSISSREYACLRMYRRPRWPPLTTREYRNRSACCMGGDRCDRLEFPGLLTRGVDESVLGREPHTSAPRNDHPKRFTVTLYGDGFVSDSLAASSILRSNGRRSTAAVDSNHPRTRTSRRTARLGSRSLALSAATQFIR